MRLRGHDLEVAVRRVERELEASLPLAFAAVGDLVVNHARRTTRFRDRTGRLRRSILRGPVSGSFIAGTLRVEVMAGGAGGVSYAQHVHDGTRAHVIRPSRREALRFVGEGGRFRFARLVRHPGTAPRPFMDDALDATSEQASRFFSSAARTAFARAGFDTGAA